MLDNAIVDKARAVRIEDELARRGFPIWTKPRHNNLGQPCPICGGRDRFSVNTKTQVFNCRRCGGKGDAIALVRHLDGLSFEEAVGLLTDHVPPSRTVPDPGIVEVKRLADNKHRLTVLRIWRDGVPEDGTGLVARYLRDERGIALSREDFAYLSPRVIRFHSCCPFGKDKDGTQLYCPAMDGLPVPERRHRCGAGGFPDRANAFGQENRQARLRAARRPVWAMAGTDGIAAFPVPPGIDGLTILAEKDKPGVTASADAVRDCGCDFNDAVRGRADGNP